MLMASLFFNVIHSWREERENPREDNSGAGEGQERDFRAERKTAAGQRNNIEVQRRNRQGTK